MSIKIGDVEAQMPPGMFLHKDYAKRRYQSIVKLTETNSYIQRKNQIFEQAELVREERQRIQQAAVTGRDRKKKVRTEAIKAPLYTASSKGIIAEKKILQAGKLSVEKPVKGSR